MAVGLFGQVEIADNDDDLDLGVAEASLGEGEGVRLIPDGPANDAFSWCAMFENASSREGPGIGGGEACDIGWMLKVTQGRRLETSPPT